MATTTKLHDRIEALKNALCEGLYEKDEVMRLSLLTAIAGESIFFLGAPGCAKSMCARRITNAFKAEGNEGLKYFEVLLNQFSTPEDVFGNISLKALNGELEGGKEEYRRLTENMLPEADIAFIDEIWKASPAILNTLLTIINERTFKNGSKIEKVPLKALLAASNELPAKNRGLEALYDRFIMRLCVGFVQSEDNFFQMIERHSSAEVELSDEIKKLQISNSELETWKKEIYKVSLSEQTRSVISAIRKELTAQNEGLTEEDAGEAFEVGDRRWERIAHIIQTSAFLNDRNEVDLMDCQLIEYCIWNTEKQQKKVRKIVETCIQQHGLDCDTAIEEINEQIEEFEKTVDETWFKEVKEPATEKIVTIDGQKCYECIREGTQETWYVTVEKGKHDPYSNYHDLYNSNKDRTRSYDFYKNEDNIVCYYDFEIKKNPPKTHFEQIKFEDITQETKQKVFDNAHYKPIIDAISSEIKRLKEKKEKDAVPFKANLFANQDYNKSLSSKTDEAIRKLEDAEIDLGKQHNRYFKASLDASLHEGDVILKNGLICTKSEIKKISEEEKKDVIAVVCISGNKTYALGVNENVMLWTDMKNYVFNYGKDLPKEYSKDWKVPNKEELNEIWKNIDTINASLKAIGCTILSPQEYWSSTKNGDVAAFYQMFDDKGIQDHTTKDHKYAVRLIREWDK